eukprot:GCRY01002372.1.p1 GENE.GCRY01002372.1~~GCRY01002372.1.p1  ORF type:complete len:187 (+),score=13.57 GCRY01002372.1:223-783(+)
MSVTLNTSFGVIQINLFYHECPKTCRNFIELAKSGYYDGLLFHRVVPEFMCQTGDPFGDGTGGESIYGGVFDDEISAKLSHSGPGIVSMANCGVRNTNSSQFFITFRQCPHLDGKHTVFGQVEESCFTVLQDFQTVKTKNKKPIKPVKLFSAEVTFDPFENQPLPSGASIPEKPLIGDEGKKCLVM